MDHATVTSTTDATDVAARLQEFVGLGEGPSRTSVVDPTVVTRLVEALGDRNPVYTDEAAAAASVHGQLVAPVTSLQSWTVSAKPRGRFGTDADGQAVFRLEAAPAGSASTQTEEEAAASAKDSDWGTAIDMREFLKSEGYIAPAVTNGWFEYKRYLRHGERITIGAPLIEDITGPKRTGLGEGFFITQSQSVYDGAGDVVAIIRQRMLRAKPFEKSAEEKKSAADESSTGSSPTSAQPIGADEAGSAGNWTFRAETWGPARTAVAAGDAIPPLIVDLTPTQIAAGAIASQDWAPVHHDDGYARAMGHPGIFMNIQISTGFVGRLITDWAGPDAVIEALDLRLGVPSYVGDTMSLTGEVQTVEKDGARDRIVIAVVAQNRLGAHIRSTVTVTVPAVKTTCNETEE